MIRLKLIRKQMEPIAENSWTLEVHPFFKEIDWNFFVDDSKPPGVKLALGFEDHERCWLSKDV